MPPALPVTLPIVLLGVGTRVARIHGTTTSEPFFGPQPGSPPTHRFHDPLGEFRVCFLGENPSASFVETFLRNPPVRLITRSELAQRALTTFRILRDVRLVPLHGEGLARVGYTADVTSSPPPYDVPQALSRMLWAHSDQPDCTDAGTTIACWPLPCIIGLLARWKRLGRKACSVIEQDC